MAIYRTVRVAFWEDVKVMNEFTPEDKYFMLYLLTNTHTKQVGCYQITKRQIEFETGYNLDTVDKLLKRFEENLKVIQYDDETKELFILNWHKYNWTKSPKVLACIFKEAETIKNIDFRNRIDTLLIEYGYSKDTVGIKEKEKEKENIKNKTDTVSIPYQYGNDTVSPNKKENLIFPLEEEQQRFKKPTLEEIKKYCEEKGFNFVCENFYDYWESVDWYRGKTKIKDWKAAARTWQANQNKYSNKTKEEQIKQYDSYYEET